MIRNLCPAGQASRNGEGRIPVSLDPDKFLNFTRSQLQLIYFSVKCVTGLNDEAKLFWIRLQRLCGTAHGYKRVRIT